MKKSLVFISFAFIFLLSMSVVSANFWDWLNGDLVRKRASDGDTLVPAERTKSTECPTGWIQATFTKEKCCVPKPQIIPLEKILKNAGLSSSPPSSGSSESTPCGNQNCADNICSGDPTKCYSFYGCVSGQCSYVLT